MMLTIRTARIIQQCDKRISDFVRFLKHGIIKIIKLIVNLIMCGFSGKPKRILTSHLPRTQYWSKVLGSVRDGRLPEKMKKTRFINSE